MVEEWGTRRASFGGAGIPVHDSDVGIVGGRGTAAVGGKLGRIIFKADAFLVGAGMVDTYRATDGRTRSIPTSKVGVGCRGDGIVEFDEYEIGIGTRRPEDGAGVEIIQLPVSGPPAGSGVGLPAGAVLVVPVGDQGGRIAGVDAAVVGGHEKWRTVFFHVVHQKAGAKGAATGGDHGNRLDDVAVIVYNSPAIGGTADDVQVAGARNDGVEIFESVVDESQFEGQGTGSARG